jgi:CRISPR-associated protein Cmr3
MKNTRLFLEAQDVWFFRTSRPFGATQAASSDGEQHLLPPGGVVLGAVRTALGDRLGVVWGEYHAAWQEGREPSDDRFRRLGPPVPDGRWPDGAVRLLGCLPARLRHGRQQTLFPLPSCVLLNKEHGGAIRRNDLELALPRRARPRRSSAGELWPVLPEGDDFEGEATDLLVDASCLVHLLQGRPPGSFDVTESGEVTGIGERKELAQVEPRVGIARQIERRTVAQGHLYSLETQRWASRVPFRKETTYGLHALVRGLSSPDELGSPAALMLGGEGRLAWATGEAREGWLDEDGDANARIREGITKGKGWWLYLATPADFTKGWRPAWLGEDRVARPGGVEAGRLVGLTGGQPLLISGWDLAAKKPKPVRRLMAEGTTYFFELGDRPEAITAALSLHQTCIADDSAHAGGGLAFVGAWRTES